MDWTTGLTTTILYSESQDFAHNLKITEARMIIPMQYHIRGRDGECRCTNMLFPK